MVLSLFVGTKLKLLLLSSTERTSKYDIAIDRKVEILHMLLLNIVDYFKN